MPTQQCPVCGQRMKKKAPFCPQCGTAMALVMKTARLLTNMKWLDVLVGILAGCGLLGVIGFLAAPTIILRIFLLSPCLGAWARTF